VTRIFVPIDSTALALDAEEVAEALGLALKRKGAEAEIVRNGSRGLFWLEPLIEVETPAGRVGYGPVTPQDVPGLLDAGLLEGGDHPLRLGLVEELPWLKRQQRLTFARCGIVDPLSLSDYEERGGYRGLAKALAMVPAAIVEAVTVSGLRGRGGAGFPTGIKWKTVLGAEADQKYIVCNADEGDSGTFADRLLLEGDPFGLIEGMTIAGFAVGATQGFVYIRSEYPYAFRTFKRAIQIARDEGRLGPKVMGGDFSFDIEVRLGAGAYICGEETSLLESLEGKRGVIRDKPPLPALQGLFGKPTVVNNLVTLSTVPFILAEGAETYRDFGMGRSRGTLPVQLAGNVKRGGLVEIAFGVTLDTLINDFGGGTASGRPLRAVQIGGPLGAYFPASLLHLPMDYEALAQHRGMLGHGGMVLFDDSIDLARQARFAMEFCAVESCGKCTPCRIGSTRGVEIVDRILAGRDLPGGGGAGREVDAQIALMRDLCEVMTDGSLCALGGLTPLPVLSALEHFPEDFKRPVAAAAE
jgi:formate dehydrogenase iron-sulfur subunit